MPIHSVTQSRIAAGYKRLCKRWVSPSAAGGATAERDARMAGAFLGMPLMLAVALITSHSIAGELDAVLSLGCRRSGASDDLLRCAFGIEEQCVGRRERTRSLFLVYRRNRCHGTIDEFAALDHGRGDPSRKLVCLPQ